MKNAEREVILNSLIHSKVYVTYSIYFCLHIIRNNLPNTEGVEMKEMSSATSFLRARVHMMKESKEKIHGRELLHTLRRENGI